MAARHKWSVRHWVLAGTALSIVTGCIVGASPARAAGPLDKLDTSLNWVPDDAAFYSASLRNGEQIEAIGKSRAWAAIMELPAVQDLRKQISDAMELPKRGDVGMELDQFTRSIIQLKAAWENFEVRQAVKLLGDMFSQEVFVYGDQGAVDLIELVQRVSSEVRYGQMLGELTGEGRRDVDPAALVISALAGNLELLKVPNVIFGFRVKDRQLAVQELAKLEVAVNALLMFAPQYGDRWKRATVAGNEYLTLTLDGEMIPWSEVPVEEAREHELHKGDLDKVVKRVRAMKQVIALGLRGDYLLLAFGPSTDRLAQLGKGKSLADRPEFKPLAKYADRRIASIGYASRGFLSRVVSNTRDVYDLLKAVDRALPKLDLEAGQRDEIHKDIADLTKDLKSIDAEAGAVLSFAFLTGQGMEGYSYAWGDLRQVDAGKALSLIEHVGGKPILALLGRSRSSVGDYDMLVKWVRRGYHYFEEFGLPQIPADDREKLKKAERLFAPLVKRLDEANRTLIRALADEQFGLVIDARFKSRQFHKELPAMDRAMPMVEPALVFGVSDARALRKAMAEYRNLFNEGVETMRKVVPDPSDIPPIAIPEPKTSQTGSGTLYTFEFPEEWGLTKELVVSLGLSDHVGVVAVTDAHATRLLTPTPPAFRGVLADPARPRAMAASFHWAGLVDAATPWVEFAVRQAVPEDRPSAGETPKGKRPPKAAKPETKKEDSAKPVHAKKPAEKKAAEGKKPEPRKPKARKASVMDQVRVVLKVLKVIPAITGETYREGDALVTHTLVEVRDID